MNEMKILLTWVDKIKINIIWYYLMGQGDSFQIDFLSMFWLLSHSTET